MLEDGLRIGHILDPRSGRPVVRRASVTVWHPPTPWPLNLSVACPQAAWRACWGRSKMRSTNELIR